MTDTASVTAASVPHEVVFLEEQYNNARTRIGDIHEHMDTLHAYATEVESIIECGVETAVSSWAFVKGLYENEKKGKKLVSIDINYHPNIFAVGHIAKALGLNYEFKRGSDLCVEVSETDLTFIDTWHVYGHLIRELKRFGPITRKYIILHDTVVDAEVGETVRRGWDPIAQSRESGYPVGDIVRGLKYAVSEFLETHPEWRLRDHFSNCNGLTILERTVDIAKEKRQRNIEKIVAVQEEFARDAAKLISGFEESIPTKLPQVVEIMKKMLSDEEFLSSSEIEILASHVGYAEQSALTSKMLTRLVEDCKELRSQALPLQPVSSSGPHITPGLITMNIASLELDSDEE